MKKKRIKYFVDSSGLFTHGAIIFMALAAVFTVLGGIGMTGDVYFMTTRFALPLACELIFLALTVFFGKRTMILTALPAVLFAVFFIIRAFSFANMVRIVIFTVLYLAAAIFFTATVFGWIRNKWLLSAILFVTFAVNIVLIDYPALAVAAVSVTFTTLMQEISVLFILLALLFSALALKNKRPLEEANLPKMRSHRVIVKNNKTEDAKPAEIPEVKAEVVEAPKSEIKELDKSEDNAAIPLPGHSDEALSDDMPKESTEE